MYESSNPLSAISYTNKDFQTIYPELLETVKKLSYKWDPTISNESDPGVILLKLNAIIADKNNYNIDKNILENYPETYTQMLSARSQYRQLGYRMPWYRAATTTVRFRWIDNDDARIEDGEYITIPKYTTLTDSDNDKIFTTLNSLTIGKINNGDCTGTVDAIQGVLNTLTIAGNSRITLRNLDSQNRLYISDYNIAENGIFVSNHDDLHETLWQQVDNVEVQPSGTRCYEFDIDARNDVCYLQFPDDIDSLIGEGLTIRYIITRGYEGNVGTKVINKFYQEPEIVIMYAGEPKDGKKITIQDHIMLYNNTFASTGKDPETIEQAYKSYKRVVATFNTLVTLRDYVNALCRSDYVSNAIVTDRTNDIQSTCRIIDRDPNAIETHKTHVLDDDTIIYYSKYDPNNALHKDENTAKYVLDDYGQLVNAGDILEEDRTYVKSKTNKVMNAFDLKFYLLSRGNLVDSMDEYDITFEVDESNATEAKLTAYLADKKSLQHDIKKIDTGKLFMLQNMYPIRLKIVPTHKLSEADMNNVATNIQVALRDLLNSRNIEFGEEPQYEDIYDTVANSDERIKVVIMDDFDYTTYALYVDTKGRTTFDSQGRPTNTELLGERVIKKIPINNFDCDNIVLLDNSCCDAQQCCDTCKCNEEVETDTTVDSSALFFQNKARRIILDKKDVTEYIFIDQFKGKVYMYDPNLKNFNIYLYSDKVNEFRQEIVAKNILAGVTPLYDPHTTFNVSLDMQQGDMESAMSVKTDKISTNLTIAPFGFSAPLKSVPYDNKVRDAEYTLKANENIRFLAPSFITDKNYSNYVKYELVMKAPTGKEEYVYANPKNVSDILGRHGGTNFYKLESNGEYSKASGVQYQRVGDSISSYYPKLRANCFFTGDSGSAQVDTLVNLTDVSTGSKLSMKQKTTNTYQPWAPDFEPLMYYYNDADHGMTILTSPPNDWETNYTAYFKLKQYVPHYVSTFIDVSNDDDLESYPYPTTNYWRVKWDKSSDPSMNSLVITGGNDYTHLVEKYNSDLNYFKNGSEHNITSSDINTDLKWCKYAIKNNLTTVQNMILTNPTDKLCYEKIGGAFTDAYTVQNYHARSGNDVVCYEMIYANKSYAKEKKQLTIDREHYTIDPIQQSQEIFNSSLSAEDIYIRYVAGGTTSFAPAQKTVPVFKTGTYYRQTVLTGTGEKQYSLLYHVPSDWSTSYSEYFTKGNDNEGVVPGTVEFEQWLNGSLTLYLKERTYKVPANTDYQLREGDYITFYWRESDEDNAPYQYVRYNHIYDVDNSLPTIIRPNFNLEASSYSNVIVDTSNLEASSGLVRYDGAQSSPFQRILTQLYDDYDLSGTKQIDLRKMNSRTLDGTNYVYFITKSTDETNNTFRLKLSHIKSVDEKTAVYTYTLQNDEYFVYTNSRKDAFEVLGAGTLIKLTRKVVDSGASSAEIGKILPTEELCFEAECVKISDVMYYGIDTFKNQCIAVSNNSSYTDSWLLIEQQIYSFTAGDTIMIHMEDANNSYIPCTGPTDKEKQVYQKLEYTPVPVVYSTTASGEYINGLPDYQEGTYFVKEEDGTYTLVEEVYPLDKIHGGLDGVWKLDHNYYIKRTEYVKVENPVDFNTNYSNYYKHNDSIKYPVFRTSYNNVEDAHPSDAFVKGYTVNYKANGGSAEKLPAIIMLDEDYQWHVTATLNLNMDKDHAQCVIAGKEDDEINSRSDQSVTIGDYTYSSLENDEPLYLMSDVLVDKVGGDNVDISYVTADSDDAHKVELFAYKLNRNLKEGNNGWGKTTSGELKYVINKDLHNDTSNLSGYVAIGNVLLDLEDEDGDFAYILPVYTYNNNLTFSLQHSPVTPDTDGETIKDMDVDTEDSNYQEMVGGIRYYKLSGSSNLQIKYKFDSVPQSNAEIIFGTLFRYKEREIFNKPDYYGITPQGLEKVIRTLDVPKCFKYNHIVDDGIKILDPLDGAKFFDENHVYNKFTIARANIRFARDTGANITFVNNR